MVREAPRSTRNLVSAADHALSLGRRFADPGGYQSAMAKRLTVRVDNPTDHGYEASTEGVFYIPPDAS